jgi:hypothetical protein
MRPSEGLCAAWPTPHQARNGNEDSPGQQLHGYVSSEARDGWYQFSDRHGTNVTALLEAVGVLLAQHSRDERRALPPWLRRVLVDAQEVASSRSTRRR